MNCCAERPLGIPPAASLLGKAAVRVTLLGVEYHRLQTADGGDLYLTQFGLPFREHLAPENWYVPDWFGARRARLPGTSTIYKVPTRPVDGVSLDLVARFSRVGEPVPVDTLTLHNHIQTEFNSPFEEFALVMKLRATRIAPCWPRILTKKPLAIHVPLERLHAWQTGRLESKIAAKNARLPEVELDLLRQYILLYGWIEGLNAVQTADVLELTGHSRETFLSGITRRAIYDLEQRRYRMLDIKPEHIVLRIRPDGALVRRRDGQLAYVLVDYELLERQPEVIGTRQLFIE